MSDLAEVELFTEIAPPKAEPTPVVNRRRGQRKPRERHVVGTCVRCEQEAPIAARGLCDACYAWAKAHDRLEDYPYQRRGLPLADLVEEYELLRSAGNRTDVIAARLNMKPETLKGRLREAREQGLLPQEVSR